jgi:hypothetical protein
MIRVSQIGYWRQEVIKSCRLIDEQRTHSLGAVFPFYALHGLNHTEKVAEIGNKLMEAAGRPLKDDVQSAVWECSAYLHDVGMGVFPRDLTELQLHGGELAEYIKDGRKREKMLRKLKSVYCLFTGCRRPGEALDQCIQRGCVVNDLPDLGVVNVSDLSHLNAKYIELVRKLHPWISKKLIERDLPKELDERRLMYYVDGRIFAEVVGRIAALHAHETELPVGETARVRVYGGSYDVDIGLLGAILRASDALDSTVARTRPMLEGHRHDIVATQIDQAKHWAFKIINDVEAERGKLILRLKTVELGYRKVDPESLVLGFLLFEVGDNMAGDIPEVADYLKSRGVLMPDIRIASGGAEVSLWGIIHHMEAVYEAMNRRPLYSGGKPQYRGGAPSGERYMEELMRVGVEEGIVDKLRNMENPTPLDVLAVAVLEDKNTSGIVDLIMQELRTYNREIADEVGRLVKELGG